MYSIWKLFDTFLLFKLHREKAVNKATQNKLNSKYPHS
ncbi:hypothetical protein LDG_5476 [Legionella drancourtii LLAP12]|uniref:Uncharacterized protein n=1 Tax=Legionella drancourtii LLAP12 TaxID=658187 RepID=G9EJW0_9GAMM|nr:hypothetical protein LDG_5476 [Legionella drancourtii LLAP12]